MPSPMAKRFFLVCLCAGLTLDRERQREREKTENAKSEIFCSWQERWSKKRKLKVSRQQKVKSSKFIEELIVFLALLCFCLSVITYS